MRKYLVIERYRKGRWNDVYSRFHKRGRMLPVGLHYLNSWTNREQEICYQLMETASPELFQDWFVYWSDLIDFELVPLD